MDPNAEKPAPPRRLLVVDDKANMRDLLEGAFRDQGYAVTVAACAEDAIAVLEEGSFDAVITDLNMPGKSGIDVLRASKAVAPDTEVIIVTAYGTIDTAVEAMRLGAYDFITKPFKLAEIQRKVEGIFTKTRPEKTRTIRTAFHPAVQHMVGVSAHTAQLLKMIGKIAPSKSSVLISGPSGVGKELVARAIHESSPRRERPFVALNCAALATGVLESELFGHEKGAFTGATERHIGRFERAHNGTLFLDEVADTDPGIQTKLLRALQEGEIERVGDSKTLKVDVRIIAATNRDLQEAIASGDFREDFYYRLNVFSLRVDALRDRREDIPALVDHFLIKYSREMGKEVYEVDDDVFDVLLRYAWPGNIRELENVIERAIVLAEGPRVTREELPPELLDMSFIANTAHTQTDRNGTQTNSDKGQTDESRLAAAADSTVSLIEHTERMERDLIVGALDKFRWNKTKAAEHLGLKRTTLQYKIKKFDIE